MNARLIACLASLVAAATLAGPVTAEGDVTAAQIVTKNAAARGGVAAWSKIETMAWVGHVESAELPGRNLPFLLEQKRPNNTRFELVAENQRSVRIYDGTDGWKLRPASTGIPEMKPYTADELSFARDAQVIDGPLMNDAASGGDIVLAGVDEIQGRKAYALKITLPTGARHRIWVDVDTFLETRYERDIRNAAGLKATASVVYRDYHTFDGLQMPVIVETGSADGKAINRLVIERVALNPPIEDRMFSRPNVPTARHHGAVVDTRGPPPAGVDRPASQP